LDREFVTLEKSPTDKDCLTQIFRDLHTIRRNLGKLQEGVIDLQAFNQNRQIHIEIHDNGRSVIFHAIKNQALD
jgi:chemotaxis protein histidine kinase CheA